LHLPRHTPMNHCIATQHPTTKHNETRGFCDIKTSHKPD
jgi:hypothetical protein